MQGHMGVKRLVRCLADAATFSSRPNELRGRKKPGARATRGTPEQLPIVRA